MCSREIIVCESDAPSTRSQLDHAVKPANLSKFAFLEGVSEPPNLPMISATEAKAPAFVRLRRGKKGRVKGAASRGGKHRTPIDREQALNISVIICFRR
jgi:hypothetical protein